MQETTPVRLSQGVLRSVRTAATKERSRALMDLDPFSYVACWSEEETKDGEDCRAMVMILATKGCSWALRSGCSMCGYTNDSSTKATDESIWVQYTKAMKNLDGQKVVKIYTSGSFLDVYEISLPLRKRILDDLYRRVDEIVIETRHEYITRKNLEDILQFKDKLILAVGLESSNDRILNYSVNKPSTFMHYTRTAALASELGFRIKSYLMLKPPFLNEADAIEDAVKTAWEISPYTYSVSVNPTNIQKDTVVEMMWKKGNYRPPWLWSVVEVLVRTHSLQRRILSKPTGAGTIRGAHNCGRCDERVLNAIADYSRHRNPEVILSLDCRCRAVWKEELRLSNLSAPVLSPDYRKKIQQGDI